jgi:hypothetical protein
MTWHLDSANSMQEYINFYAHLHMLVDAQILQVLEALHSTGQQDRMLIFSLLIMANRPFPTQFGGKVLQRL